MSYKTISVRIHKDLLAWLMVRAEEDGRKLSPYIVRLLQAFQTKEEGK